jgi:TolA-binding protein
MSSLKSDMAQLQRQQSDERAQQKARLEAMETRVVTLEQTLAGLRQADADSGVQLEKVVAEVQALRGDIEQARHELGETSASVKSILERPPASVAAAASAPKVDDPNKPTSIGGAEVPPDAKAHYDFAKKLFDTKKYTESAEAFDLFLLRHADKKDLVDNAAYWKAESLFALAGSLSDQKAKEKALRQAILAYQRVLEDPKSEKADSALFKVGTAFEQLGFKDEAVICYQELIDKHPKSPLVKDAKARLKAIGPKKKK